MEPIVCYFYIPIKHINIHFYLYNFIVFVATFSQNALSCSINKIVGSCSINNFSICIREMTSIKFNGSSQIYKCARSHKLLAINTFFFCPPLKSSIFFSNCSLEKSSFLSIDLNKLSSIQCLSAYSDKLPYKSEVSCETYEMINLLFFLTIPLWGCLLHKLISIYLIFRCHSFLE